MSKVTFDFTGENYVVTGASSGMGKQIAIELAQAGANVLAIARRENELTALHIQYPNIIPGVADVCDYDMMEKVITDFVKQYGKLNGGVHSAGISGLTPLRAYDETEARKIMDISFWAGAKFMQICTKRKNTVDGSSFVWFSSASANACLKGLFAYAGAKSATQIAVRTFAKELAPRRIRINSVSPGWVNSPMTEGLAETRNMDEILSVSLFGFGEVTDVSGGVLFLLSDKASWVNGAVFLISGGAYDV